MADTDTDKTQTQTHRHRHTHTDTDTDTHTHTHKTAGDQRSAEAVAVLCWSVAKMPVVFAVGAAMQVCLHTRHRFD